MSYNPHTPAPTDAPGLASWVLKELRAIATELNAAAKFRRYAILYAAPARTYPGMEVYADGTTWNPGSGEGLYRRNKTNTAWVFVG